jgi:hypothetical protein
MSVLVIFLFNLLFIVPWYYVKEKTDERAIKRLGNTMVEIKFKQQKTEERYSRMLYLLTNRRMWEPALLQTEKPKCIIL